MLIPYTICSLWNLQVKTGCSILELLCSKLYIRCCIYRLLNGSAPIVSYHYGAKNHIELKNLFKKSLSFISICGVCLTILSFSIASPLSKLFVGYDKDLFALTVHGFRIYCLTFLVNGFNIYGSSFFTALNNGLISATISFLRTLVFQIIVVMTLPILFGINGIWIAVAVAELLTLCFTIFFFINKRKVYHY